MTGGGPTSPGWSILRRGPSTSPVPIVRGGNSSGNQAPVGMMASFPRPAGITRMVPLSTCLRTKSRIQGALGSTVHRVECLDVSCRLEGREGRSGVMVGLPVPRDFEAGSGRGAMAPAGLRPQGSRRMSAFRRTEYKGRDDAEPVPRAGGESRDAWEGGGFTVLLTGQSSRASPCHRPALRLPDYEDGDRSGTSSQEVSSGFMGGGVPLSILALGHSCFQNASHSGPAAKAPNSTSGATCSTFQRAPVCFILTFSNCLIEPSTSPLPIDCPRCSRST